MAGHPAEALTAIRTAIRLDPGTVRYQLEMARIHQRNGEQKQAVDVLETARKLDPRSTEIPYSIAVSYFIANSHARRMSPPRRPLLCNWVLADEGAYSPGELASGRLSVR